MYSALKREGIRGLYIKQCYNDIISDRIFLCCVTHGVHLNKLGRRCLFTDINCSRYDIISKIRMHAVAKGSICLYFSNNSAESINFLESISIVPDILV